ncbi:MAG: ABC transporter ATP-binding protein [Peptococcaceae bacterium]|nr:ABC transporter ATP-binding protein [Peptococcaceae bacterium]
MITSFRKFFAFAGRQSRSWYLGLFYEVIRCILEALQFAALFVVLDALVHDTMTRQTALVAFGIMLASVIGTIIFWDLAHGKEGEGSYRMCEDKRIQIGARMKYMPMGYFNSHSLGNLTSVSTATMSDLESMSFAVIVRTLVGVMHASIFSLAMCVFSWKISLIFLSGVVLFMVINTMLLRCSKRLSPQRLEAQTVFMDAVLEYIQGMGVVRAFHLADKSNSALEQSIRDTQRKNQLIERQRIPYIAAEQVVLRIASAAAAFCAIVLFVNGTLALTFCLMILVSAFMVYSQLESAGEMFFMLSMIDASIDRVEEIHQTPQMDIDGKDQTPAWLDIEMQDVCFSYGEKQVIDHVSLRIPQGTTTAIVGPSGSGKTTLVNLIARFWDVDSGSVRLGGIDVRNYKLDSLMQHISMVFQNVYLFPDSIENNIKFGAPKASHEDVVKAAKAARCHDFIMALPDGYDTVIGEGGATISGGEKQRLSIARAMMKDAPIIILDEATANVDPENEAALQKAIEALTRGKTIIMIAHRLKTVKNADQIIVLDQGKIAQQGTHAELMAQPGIYAAFVGTREKASGWKIQAGAIERRS